MGKQKFIWTLRQVSYIMYKRKIIRLSSDILIILNTIRQWVSIFKTFKQEKFS